MHRSVLFVLFALQTVNLLAQVSASDLGSIVHEDQALASVEIVYRVDEQLVALRGDGTVMMQSTVQQRQLQPACKGRTAPENIRRLLETMLTAHFLDLPQKSYMVIGDDIDWRKLRLHSITVKTSEGKTTRPFSAGEYGGEHQEIPANFAAIEKAIIELKSKALPEGTLCTVSPPL